MKKKILFILLLFLLCLSWLQSKLSIFNIPPLSGVVESTEKPTIDFKSWWDGNFQTKYSKHEDETFGLRNIFIKIYNQFDYTLFKKPHGEVVIGKHDYLFQGNHINEMTGWNYIGDEAMKLIIKNIHTAEKYLNKNNTLLLTVIAPGKTDYYKEYMPEFYTKRISNYRNYTAIIKYSKEEKIRILDLNKLFLQMKDTCTYPLFPKQGIHWNYYGMAIASDTIIKYIETENKINLPKISWTMELSETIKGTDYDLGDLLNIYQKLLPDKMVSPNFKITEDSTTAKLRLLVIGDSFYWSIYNQGVFKNVFKNETFYYYCSSIIPKEGKASPFVSDLNFLKEIKNYDVIILLQSSGNYGNPGVNFIQTLLNEIARYDILYNIEKQKILNNKLFLKRVEELSSNLNISQDSSIAFLSDSLTEVILDEISKIKIQMRQNPEWMEYIIQKSEQQKKPVDQIMQADAEWTYKKNIK